ncbi:TMEM175 family protein [Kribbella sp. NPDC051770]|uniref:TMEM175 family protein n=1 Tax=Kribbella sp. NPDC051770 TaxID=3155413 RepID=UPI003445533B
MSRNPDRLVLFTDAVVAIAVTLLVLPLVDVVAESKTEGLSATEVFTEHRAQFWTFLLSFVVIARFWLVHHRVFEHVRQYTTRLIQVNLIWLLVIVLLPFPTEIIGTYPADRFTAGFYIGTILVLSLCQTVLVLLIRRHPEIENPDNPVTRGEVINSLVTAGLFATAFVLAALVPGVNFWALFLLFLTPAISRPLINRKP